MTEKWQPLGEERQIKTLEGASVDGTPVAYIVVLAAVVTVLAFIPFSFILATGGSMPLSQSIFPLLGWILGPIAGALASGIGTTIGIFLAPYTAGLPFISIAGAVLTSFVAGTMVVGKSSATRRRYWWLILSIIFVIQLSLYYRHALDNGVPISVIIAGSFVDWSALLLYIFPTRTLFGRWIKSENVTLVALGVFCGVWMTSGVAHLSMTTITYYMFNWPKEVWITLIPIIPIENLIRCLAGTVIGTGVISGLRSINLVKSREAIY